MTREEIRQINNRAVSLGIVNQEDADRCTKNMINLSNRIRMHEMLSKNPEKYKGII